MKRNLLNRVLAALLGIVSITLAGMPSAWADDLTWWGLGATPNWNDLSGNWTNLALNAAAPANTDDAIFLGTGQLASSNDISGLSLGWLWLDNGSYTITGNPITLTGGITNSFDGNTIGVNVTFSGAQAIEQDAGTLTFSGALTNSGGLTINGAGTVAWTDTSTTNVTAQLLTGSGNLTINGPSTVTVSGGFIYPAAGPNFPGNTIVNNGGILNMGAGCFDGNSPIGQSLTINPGGTVANSQPHIAGASGRPISIYGGTLNMGASAYFTTIILSNALVGNTLSTADIRGTGSFTNLASSAETLFQVALNLTSSRVIGVDKGSVSPDIDFQGNGTSAINDSGSLTKVGPGTMLISGADIHTGTTTISAGTLALSSTMANTPLITVASNAVFDISAAGFALSANQTLAGVGMVIGTLNDNNAVTGSAVSPAGNGVAGTLTMDGLSLGGYVNLNFDLAGTTGVGGGTNDLLIVTNLTLASGVTNTVNFSFGGTPAAGAYTLIRSPNGNGITPGPVTTLAAAASRSTYNFTTDGTNIFVTVVANPAPLVWRGDGATNNWDLNTSSNWINGAVKDVFLTGDNATFTDTGSNTPPINLVSALTANLVTVASSKDYSFAGSGKITGGGKLLKSNSGNLTILTANDNTGGGGLNGSGVVTVGNGGTTVASIGSGLLTNNTKVTFFENTSVTYAGNMSGTGSLVSFMPGATLTLTGTNTLTGGLVAANGTTQIGNNTVGVSPSVAGNITNYSTLNIYRSDAFTNQNYITSAGNTLEYGNGDVNVRGAGGMTVDGSGSINLLPQGSLSIGQSASGMLTVNPNAVINIGANFLLGNPGAAGNYGIVVQNGGTINVGNNLRIGHWDSEVSFYTMNGGVLNVPNNDLAVGWDGRGLMTLANGTVNCRTLSVDDNGISSALNGTNSTFTMTGGTLNIGTGGIGGATQTNAVLPTILLSGGTIGTLVPSTLVPAGWSSVMNLRLTNGTPTFDSSNSIITLSGGLSGNGGLTKQGSGYLNLNNATNSYTGTTTVAAGTLQGSGTVVGPIVVQSGANLSAGATFATGTLTASNVTVNTGGNVVIDASSTAATSDLLYVKGALTLNSTPLTLNFLGGTPYTGGAYTIISNLVARSGTLVYNNPTRYAATLDQSQAARVQVSFSGANAALVWQGGVSTNWNVNTDYNWLNAGVADKFYQSDAVIFDNSGITKSNVNLVAAMTPASVTVDSTGNYTFSGSPIAGVATLTKVGSGTLTLLNSNAYTGLTTIAGGTLQVGNGGTNGYLTSGTVDNYGSLVFNRSDTVNFNGVVNGSGSLTQAGSNTLLITSTQNHSGGTTINPGSTLQLGNGVLGDVGSLGSFTVVTNNGTVIMYRTGSGLTVVATYTGPGSLIFQGTGNSGQSSWVLNATNTFTGPVTLNYARIAPGFGAQSFGSPSSITVNPGSGVYAIATNLSPTFNMPLTLAGTGWQDGLGALRIESVGNPGNWAGNITLASNARIGVNNASTNIISGNITGNYELETYGGNAAAALILSPALANTYNALRVSIGTAGAKTIAGNVSAIPNNIPLTMNGGTLQLNGYSKSFSPFLNLNASSSIQNGSTSSVATVTLAPVLGSSTYSGTFADGASQPLNVTFTQTPGLWSLTLGAASASWTGNLTNNGGTITVGSANYLGSQSAFGRSIVLNNGANLVTTINNALSGYNGNMVLTNSTWTCNRYVSFSANAGYLYLANSTLTGSNGTDTAYYNISLPSTVMVRGTAPSYMVGIGNSMGYDLQPAGSGGTTFDVADATGNANSDLIVGGGSSTAFIRNQANSSTASTLIKTGLGTLELDGNNSYTGPTLINVGTLALGASATIASPSITVAGGAKFDVSAISGGLGLITGQTLGGGGTVNGSISDGTSTVIQPGGNGTAGTLTITTNLTLGGSGSLNIDLSNNTGSGNDLIQVNRNLTLSSGTPTPVNFTFLNGAPAMGVPYTLIQCSGTSIITGTAATAFTNAANSRFTTAFSQTATAIQVTFSGSASNLVWTGTDPVVPSTWDVATSTNWFDGSGGNVFYQNDTVRFDDTSVNTTVNITATVNPTSIIFDSTNNYTLNGSGHITGLTTITKNNTNTVIMTANNTAVGPLNVNAGIYALGNNDTYVGATVITVSNGAAFDFAGNNDNVTGRAHTFVIAGSGPDGQGALRNDTYDIYSYAGVSNLTLAANSVIGTGAASSGNTGRWDIGPGLNTMLNGQGHNLTIVGVGPVDLRPQFITNVNSITISNALTWYEGYNQTNAWTTTTTNYVYPGSSLGIYGGQAINLPVVLTNATILNQGGGTPNWLSAITLQGTNVFNNGGAQVFSGVISGPGAIAIGGGSTTWGAIPGILTFSNVNTFSGGLVISNAPVTLANNAAVAGYAAVVVTSSNGLGSGPITFDLSLMTTNAMTNTARVIEFNVTGGGVIPNAIVLPTSGTAGVTNLSIQGRDNSSVFTLSGQISGGYAGLTNWFDSATSGSLGVLRLSNPANNFVAPTINVNRGNLAITADGCLGNAANVLKLSQGNGTITGPGLRFDAPNINLAHSINLAAGTVFNLFGCNDGDGVPETMNNATISGFLSGASAIYVIGTNATLTVSGLTNTYSGGFELQSPVTLQVAASTNLGTAYVSIKAGSTFRYTGTGSETMTRALWSDGGGVLGGGTIDIPSATAVLTWNPASGTLNQGLTKTGAGALIYGTQSITGGYLVVNNGAMTVNSAISGTYTPVTVNGGTLTLNGANTCLGGAVVNGGNLFVNGSLPVGEPVSVSSGGTLGGIGTINAPVTVQTGGKLTPGTNAVGRLTVNSALNLFGNTVMVVNKGVSTNSIVGISTVLYGGTLTVSNFGGAFGLGDSFKLFSAQSYQGGFTATNLPSISPLAWNWTPTNGTLSVVNGINTNPTNITATVSGSTLTLSWPADHTGWRLLVQTNNRASGISSNTNDWMTVPGSSGIDQTNITIDPTLPTEFYRLVYP